MWKDKVIKRSEGSKQIEKNIKRFIDELDNMWDRLSALNKTASTPRAQKTIERVLTALEVAEEELKDALEKLRIKDIGQKKYYVGGDRSY